MLYNDSLKGDDAEMAVTRRHMDYTNQYIREKYERVSLTVQKGMREQIATRASALGLSTNQYITKLILSDLSTITPTTPPDPDVNT